MLFINSDNKIFHKIWKEIISKPKYHKLISDNLIKIVIIGDKVGKTALLHQYSDNIWIKDIKTLGLDFKVKSVSVKNITYILQIVRLSYSYIIVGYFNRNNTNE